MRHAGQPAAAPGKNGTTAHTIISREEFEARNLHVYADRVWSFRWALTTFRRLLVGNFDKSLDEWWVEYRRKHCEGATDEQAGSAHREFVWQTLRLRKQVYRGALALEFSAVAALVLVPLPIWGFDNPPLWSLSLSTAVAFVADHLRSKNKFWLARDADGGAANQYAVLGGGTEHTTRDLRDVL